MHVRYSLFIVAVVMGILLPDSVRAQSNTDPLNGSRGGHVISSTSTQDGFPPDGLLDGTTRPTLFVDDNFAGDVYSVIIQAGAGDVTFFIRGVDLFSLSDGGVEDGLHGTSAFRLFADADGDINNGFESLLVDGLNPRDDGTANRYLFAPVHVYQLLAQFTRSTDTGPRIVELDGIAVPEPGFVLPTLSLAALWGLRRPPRER